MSPPPLQTSPAFLSTRLSLAWIPEPPSEHTDTLVLTGAKYYVDCRVRKNTGEIDWVMAGTAEEVDASKDGKSTIRFTNFLDSRLPSSSTVASTDDIATFTPLADGNTLEEGSMINAVTATSEKEKFEEVWGPVSVASGSTVLILQSLEGTKAFVGVCGEYALGVYVRVGAGGYGGWKATKEEPGEGWSVCWERGGEKVGWEAVKEKSEGWREGDEVEVGGRRWRVLEHSLTE